MSVAIAASANMLPNAPAARGQRAAIKLAKSLSLRIVSCVTAVCKMIAMTFAARMTHSRRNP
jgi:hypothetical protein